MKEKTQGGPEEFGMTREDGPVETREKPPGGKEYVRSHKVLAFPERLRYACVPAKSLQLCLTLCDPIDCSPPGSSVHGILQAKILEWVAMLSSRGSPRLKDQTLVPSVSCTGRWVLYH